MHGLPLTARVYLWFILFSSILLILFTFPIAGELIETPMPALVILIGMVLAHRAEVVFERRPGERIIFAVDDALMLFSVSTLGQPGVLAVATGLLVAQISQRKAWERVAFNVGMICLTYSLSTFVFELVQPNPAIPFAGQWGFLAFLTVAVTYYATNNLLVSVMIGLAGGQSILRTYSDSLFRMSWVHLLLYAIGAALSALYAVDPWLLFYGAIILIVARYAFATVAALHSETRQRQQLAEERATLYQEQARLNAELDRAARLAELGTFSAGIAHEFNNVLTAVIGHAQIGGFSDKIEEKQYSLDVIERVCQRATSITGSLLTFARRSEPDLAPAHLEIAIDETLALVRHDLEREQIRLEKQIDPLPMLLCDIGQINQVLLNLITNARDAVRDQTNPTIQIGLHSEGASAMLTVRDNGSGMPPEVLDRIFQPFVTTKSKGNGLGMAICYGIITAHKGTIEVASELGSGTVVTLRLPITPIEANAILTSQVEVRV
ncbi:MAG: hypothetical protein HC822_00790 [Oscillochloris sp.]|nr:hypothetical protein [Oscillochloris sp.]